MRILNGTYTVPMAFLPGKVILQSFRPVMAVPVGGGLDAGGFGEFVCSTNGVVWEFPIACSSPLSSNLRSGVVDAYPLDIIPQLSISYIYSTGSKIDLGVIDHLQSF